MRRPAKSGGRHGPERPCVCGRAAVGVRATVAQVGGDLRGRRDGHLPESCTSSSSTTAGATVVERVVAAEAAGMPWSRFRPSSSTCSSSGGARPDRAAAQVRKADQRKESSMAEELDLSKGWCCDGPGRSTHRRTASAAKPRAPRPPQSTTPTDARVEAGPHRQGDRRRSRLRPEPPPGLLRSRDRGSAFPPSCRRIRRTGPGDLITASRVSTQSAPASTNATVPSVSFGASASMSSSVPSCSISTSSRAISSAVGDSIDHRSSAHAASVF